MDSQDYRIINVGVDLRRDFPVDTISVSVDLRGTHDTRAECTSEYNRLLREVLDALVGIGIPADEVKNSDFRISAHTEALYAKDEGSDYYYVTNRLMGYDYSANMSLTRPFANSEDAKAIWVALASCSDPMHFSISFCLADMEEAKSSLLAEAVAEGHRRAGILAEAAGAHVTGIHTISYEYADGYQMGNMLAPPSAALYKSRESAPDFNPADVSVRCSVQMQWRMELG
ncbi:MAG: SIMPL domain-containing protein [Atopobiaceae bacterium]|nr:SIMPL domain-containing protein [Atopobiaceae bacterium]